jgi:CubicO group peptidase (beta-lactamase class C family)
MIEKLQDSVKKNGLNFYDIAVITDAGEETAYCQPCNSCNDSYSIAKLFICTAIGILVDNGLLSLDDSITDILADEIKCRYDERWNKVTVRHALTHRTGIGTDFLDIDTQDVTKYETDDYLDMIMLAKPAYEPGTQFKYTDVPHYLLSRVITHITGLKADELINKKILVPLSFREAAWSRCPMNYTIGSTGLYARASDIVKLGWTYLNYGTYNGREIVSPEWVRRAESEGYDIYDYDGFLGKAGLRGQMVLYCREKRIAVAWHSYEMEHRDRKIINCLKEL